MGCIRDGMGGEVVCRLCEEEGGNGVIEGKKNTRR